MSKVQPNNSLLVKPGSLLIFKYDGVIEYGVFLGVDKLDIESAREGYIYKCYWPTSHLQYTTEDETDFLEFRNEFIDQHG